jgi:transcriptional antiterminator RfaH
MTLAHEAWLVVRYKINERLRFERNLHNQNIDFYIPRIFTNTPKGENQKSEVLFPGYGFVKQANINLQALRNTLGLITIIRFGDQLAIAKHSMITQFKELEYSSKIQPIPVKGLTRDDEVMVASGPFKGYVSKILTADVKDRVTILISLLGSERTLTLSVADLQKL